MIDVIPTLAKLTSLILYSPTWNKILSVQLIVVRNNALLLQEEKVKVKAPSLTILVNWVAPIAVSLAFGPHSYVSTVNATVGGWPSFSNVSFTPMLFPEVLNAKQGNGM